ncbi:SMI1/KNR4 family protein, partial [Corynebacterium sp. H127]|uniref:SMI1/KNR4 family protein n=1 Tax=Corynebacterium sp. H127 TaxID=3133418 RepID=UPI0030978F6F
MKAQIISFTELFSTCAEPCSQQRLQDIESNIGMTLPEDYRHMILTTGGGKLAYEKRFFPAQLDAFGFPDGFALWGFFGNGSYTGT